MHVVAIGRPLEARLSIPPLSWSCLFATLYLAACGEAAPTDPYAIEPTWRIDPAPLLVISDDLGTSAIPVETPIAAFMTPTGEVVVVDAGYHGLRYFSADGAFLRQVGREGDGPGEFRTISRAHRCGDRLVIESPYQKVHHSHDLASGIRLRSYEPSAPPGERSFHTIAAACGPDGRFIRAGYWDPQSDLQRPQAMRLPVPYWVTDSLDTPAVELGMLPGPDLWMLGRGSSGPLALGKWPVVAMGADRIYIGTGDSLYVEVYSRDGEPLGLVGRSWGDTSATPDDVTRYKYLDTLAKPNREDTIAMRSWEMQEWPTSIPAYTALHVDRDDNLWIRSFPRSVENLVRWVVFSPAGVEIGSVDLPSTLEVFDIGTDWVLGIETRLEDGGQQVRMYRLRRD